MKKRKDGRYPLYANLRNPITDEVKKVVVYGRSMREAAEKKRQLLLNQDAYWASATGNTFEAFCVNTLKQKVADHRMEQTTMESYMYVLKRNVFPQLPKDAPISDVNVMRIKHLLGQIQQDRLKQYVYTILHSLLKEAVFEGVLDNNPCDHIRKPRHKPRPAEVITPEQYTALMQAVADTQMWFIFFLAFETGMRRGELCGLKWDKIKGNTISVSASLKYTSNGLVLGAPKTVYGKRTLVISPAAVQALAEWKLQLKQELMSQGLPLDRNSYVFRSPKDISQPMPPDFLTHKMVELRKQLDLPARTCLHSFRHTHATMIASLDISPKKIQARLGHADAGFTLNRYVHKNNMDAGILDAVAKIEATYGVNADSASDCV